METAPCGHCYEPVDFNIGITSGGQNQPQLAHSICSACGWMNTNAPGSDLVGAQEPTIFVSSEGENSTPTGQTHGSGVHHAVSEHQLAVTLCGKPVERLWSGWMWPDDAVGATQCEPCQTRFAEVMRDPT